MGPRRTLAGALAAPLLLLAACGGGDTSIADPPISPGSTTSSPTDQPHRESPEHFIRRWFDAGTKMQNSGKTRSYVALQDRCSDCVTVADRVERTYAAGGYFKTRGVRDFRVTSSAADGNTRLMDVRVDLFPTTYLEHSGGTVKHFTGGPAHFQVGLKPSGESWLVTSFVQVAS
jgi:hypothetical protein